MRLGLNVENLDEIIVKCEVRITVEDLDGIIVIL